MWLLGAPKLFPLSLVKKYFHLTKFNIFGLFLLKKNLALQIVALQRKRLPTSLNSPYMSPDFFSSLPSPPPSNLSNLQIPIYAGITTPHTAHSGTPRGGSLTLNLRPLPLAPPADDSRFPPPASSLVGAQSASSSSPSRSRARPNVVLAITKPCLPQRRPHRHEAVSIPVSSFT